MGTKSTLGVFCLEGDWNVEDPADRLTIEPALEMLDRVGVLKLHHRNVNTHAELWRHLDNWNTKAFDAYRFLYLGFHGEPEVLDISGDPLGLDTLGARLQDQCWQRVVFLSSCGALNSSDESLKKFCKKADADAVVGYTENVDFVEAAAFEMILFGYLAAMPFGTKPPRSMYKRVTENFPDFTHRLGFRVATKTWVS
ncbi:hypothetical protein QEN40_18650 [Gordonia alkanivorans]|uniref:DUF6642 family protein n=1 Tax=Gordonia TaxID=2053 RepID=UPI0012BB4757|nr:MULTISPECIES: DUF6642 family protein [Gordonia]MDH3017530.1 hypothetical protein [Gordonia alkanivorans]MDH3019898.1 hypothetical protein [Gordonia alkanivorans]MDH3042987.1 hypothetical protein [Gordonia alkanivorans]MDH3061323.1 hypothetical protein [Gordonia alkanivorans]QGP86989.1 hypothetical protein GKZ92_04540 [Gordonia sp. 135]